MQNEQTNPPEPPTHERPEAEIIPINPAVHLAENTGIDFTSVAVDNLNNSLAEDTTPDSESLLNVPLKTTGNTRVRPFSIPFKYFRKKTSEDATKADEVVYEDAYNPDNTKDLAIPLDSDIADWHEYEKIQDNIYEETDEGLKKIEEEAIKKGDHKNMKLALVIGTAAGIGVGAFKAYQHFHKTPKR